MAQIRPRNIVFVGNRGCGKSSIITCCFKLRSTRPSVRMSMLKTADSTAHELPLIIDPIYLETDRDKEGVPMLLMDTAAKDVTGTQEHIRQSDLIAVVASIIDETHLDKAKDYWLNDQLKHLRPTQPMCLVLNKVDCINSEEHEMIIAKRRELLEDQVWEKVFHVSSKTGSGIEQMLKEFSNTLKSVRSYPHAVLYNRWENKLCANFRVAITRVFRCLDVNDNGYLGFAEFQVLYKDILNTLEFTREGFNFSVHQLKLDCVSNVNDGGVTLQGFLVLMHQMVLDRKWKDIWTILRYFNYEDDLTLTPRWTLPELKSDQVIKLLPKTFKFLEELFMIYSVPKQGQPVISTDAIANLLNVMPGNESSAMITLSLKSNMFETDNDPESPSLTLNGWLSFWAILANENAPTMLRQLDYLLSSSKRTNSGEWFSVCQPKSAESESKHSERNFIRALVLSDIEVGKSTFCRKLIHSYTPTRRDGYAMSQQKAGYEIYCNRVQIPDNPYCFLCLTEIRSDNQSLEKAVKLLPAYDLVLLAYDLSNRDTFRVMEDILKIVLKFNVANLPIQVLGLKDDIKDRSFKRAPKRLEELGLQPQEVTSAKHCDLTKTFEAMVRLGQMPGAGRARPRPKTGICTYIKRTVTISMLCLIVYGLYRVYQRKIGVNEISNSVSIANPTPIEPSNSVSIANPTPIEPIALEQPAALGVVGALNTRQGKQL